MQRLPYNACDYRCERCHVTAECAVFRNLQRHPLLKPGAAGDGDPSTVLEALRASFRETEQMIKQKARDAGVDVDEIAGGSSSPEIAGNSESMRDDPLYRQSGDFTEAVRRLLQSVDRTVEREAREYLSDLAWHHTIIPAKVFRALGWRTGKADEIAVDGKNSAAVAAKSAAICVLALDHLASRYPSLAPACRELSSAACHLREEINRRFKLRSEA